MIENLVILDNHRLLKGDATNKEDLDELINNANIDLLITDPPYGLNIVRKEGTLLGKGNTHALAKLREYSPVINDDKPFDPKHLLDLNVPSIIFGANNFSSKLPDNSKWFVWYKKPKLEMENKNISFGNCELAWTNLPGKSVKFYQYTWFGMVRSGERRLELKERIHPTQKPVGLLMQMIEDYCPPGGNVLDLYGGSGSTLIAAAETGRNCYMMELSDDYFDLIQTRYHNYRTHPKTCKLFRERGGSIKNKQLRGENE